MLAMARGFQATLAESGSPHNAMIRRGGASSEMESAVELAQVRVISDAPGVARDSHGTPLVYLKVELIASFLTRSSGTDANVQVRGVTPTALQVHDGVKIGTGRFLAPGLAELVVGSNATKLYRGFELGATPRFGGRTWTVVGILDAGGGAFDSEIWCDGRVLNQTYKRPESVYQSVTVRLDSPSALDTLRRALTSDPRLTVQAERETDYYARQSQAVSTMIRVLGVLVASVMEWAPCSARSTRCTPPWALGPERSLPCAPWASPAAAWSSRGSWNRFSSPPSGGHSVACWSFPSTASPPRPSTGRHSPTWPLPSG